MLIKTLRNLLLLLVFANFSGCKKQGFDQAWTKERAPEKFAARFVTTKGEFEIEVERRFSPLAADRFYQLVKHGYFDNGIFYRVVSGFVAQFGNTNSVEMAQWRSVPVPDEKVILPNKRGSVSFARYGAVSRDLELFINLKDNEQLDTINIGGVRGFPAIGKVTKGMEIVDQLYSEYGEETMTDANLYTNRAAFYQKYPKLDLIREAYLVE